MKVAPNNEEIEIAVLGAMLSCEDDLHIAADLLTKECFYNKNLQKIYTSCIEIYNSGKIPDIISISDKLKNKISTDFLADIIIKSSTNIQEHSLLLKEYLMRRELINGRRLLDKAYDINEDIFNILGSVSSLTDNIAKNSKIKNYYSITQVITKSLQNIEQASKNTNSITGIPTGFSYLDKLTNGFNKGELIILAARPGMGKTTLALNFLTTAANFNKQVLFFSLEMGATEIGYKILSNTSKLDHDRIKKGKLTNKEYNKIHKDISNTVNNNNIIIDDSPALDIYQLRTIARKLNHEKKLDFIIVDYLQLIQGQDRQNKQQNREQQISYISRQLKILSKELSLPVLCLSQLSRAVESRADKTPMLSDLRESGAIEQDADLVIFIYRDGYYSKNKNNEACNILVAKNRHGETGKVAVTFKGAISTFLDEQTNTFGL